MKLKIKKGDRVRVISGKSKGKEGEVIEVMTSKSRVVIDEVNMVQRHVKPSAQNPEGGIERKPAALHISNVMLLDPKSGEPTRVGRKADDKGKLRRFSKKTQEFID